ncbi:MAG: hypothetical protein RL376_184, partial [Verrucomicrobiota bacterium]
TVQRDQTTAVDSAKTGSSWSDTTLAKPSSSYVGTLDLAAERSELGTAQSDKGKLEDVRFGQAGVWLRFFTNVSDTNSGDNISAPRAVSYQICREKIGKTTSANDQVSYTLYRSEVNPKDTFTNGYNITDTVYDQPGSINGGDSVPATIRKPHDYRVIANNVIDFGVRFINIIKRVDNSGNPILDSSGREIWDYLERFPVQRKYDGSILSSDPKSPYLVTSTTNPTYTSYDSTGTPITGFPVVAEIMVRILTQEGVNQIQAFESGKVKAPDGTSDADHWWTIAEQNSNVFIRRVEIKSTAL